MTGINFLRHFLNYSYDYLYTINAWYLEMYRVSVQLSRTDPKVPNHEVSNLLKYPLNIKLNCFVRKN